MKMSLNLKRVALVAALAAGVAGTGLRAEDTNEIQALKEQIERLGTEDLSK